MAGFRNYHELTLHSKHILHPKDSWRALLAKTLSERAHLYVWDEPLNFVDVLSRMQIRDLLLAANPTMLLVEHDKTFVDEIAIRRITL